MPDPHAQPGDDPHTIYCRGTPDGGVAIVCGTGVIIDKQGIVAFARTLLEFGGFGHVDFYRGTALGYVDIDDHDPAEMIQLIDAEAEKLVAERRRRRRAELKAQRNQIEGLREAIAASKH